MYDANVGRLFCLVLCTFGAMLDLGAQVLEVTTDSVNSSLEVTYDDPYAIPADTWQFPIAIYKVELLEPLAGNFAGVVELGLSSVWSVEIGAGLTRRSLVEQVLQGDSGLIPEGSATRTGMSLYAGLKRNRFRTGPFGSYMLGTVQFRNYRLAVPGCSDQGQRLGPAVLPHNRSQLAFRVVIGAQQKLVSNFTYSYAVGVGVVFVNVHDYSCDVDPSGGGAVHRPLQTQFLTPSINFLIRLGLRSQ